MHYSHLVSGKTYRVLHTRGNNHFAPRSYAVKYMGFDVDGDLMFRTVNEEGEFTGYFYAFPQDVGDFFDLEEMGVAQPSIAGLSPQCKIIIKHLQKGNTLTQRSALMDFGIAALPRRIADLKEHGFNISSVMEKNKLTGQRYARYGLAA
ncbi:MULTISPECIES: helix-turn-helix domain-containing protein [unclassified Thioalkalivibrio]|uniref:helix-turn-helix domain-containing protein n=1 Tax=unclassified Thioalkalivibrio TaxID=2621013 RepID=UPI00036F49A1|nr:MULTISPECIES: helix-turn-helix domain-containing protein [unclassified Thioalkalivibrio]